MTTATWANNSMSHADDAGYRAWGGEISSYLSTVGFVQTADTGQVNWTTATRPAVNISTDYEIWRFNDSLQGTAPIFFKLRYGTGSNLAYPVMVLDAVGTGSNGSGTITGQTTSAAQWICYTTDSVNAGSFNCYACHTDGVGWLLFRQGETPDRFFFAIARTSDNTGAFTGHGCVVLYHSAGSSAATRCGSQSIRFAATSETFQFAGQGTADSNNFFILPGSETDTSVGGDTQATVCIGVFPEFKPCGGLGVAMLSELAVGSTAAISFFGGSATSTYIQLGTGFGDQGARTASADDQAVGLVALWE